MKQRLLKVSFMCMAMALLPLTTHASDEIEINATNFPDDNFRNYLLEQEYGKDGKLTKAEIENVNKLDVVGKNISSLQGIEYFTALATLNCSNNQLTALDVSRNIILRSLGCYKNRLTALDVSKNAKLINLYCYDNQLTTLDVSECVALEKLYCYSNQLTVLNVSKSIALTSLWCEKNLLTTLDVSECTALTSLRCYNNQLTSLDVSRNVKLGSLNCSNNQLTALDVSKHTILGSLDCSNNQLTALDVSKNTALNTLYFHCNQIKGTSMDNLINSLPTNNNADSFFELYVYSSVNPNEGNVCTKEQVLAAEEKGWRVWCEIDAYGGWTYYEGSDDTPSNVNDIRTETGQDAPVYD
ncbi:MAG: hypothetical protein K2G91_07650, partial [Prevotella sp.]|nr:hypothetical protein [Prevotella sp.]